MSSISQSLNSVAKLSIFLINYSFLVASGQKIAEECWCLITGLHGAKLVKGKDLPVL